ncbi:hypothetical protein D0962_21925 [Leptolyngbyaceae cyanobacterium CCMR0082]|uniref:HTH luxR-type domain-containing protein n=1 Tax=Adonisia turfae CCMR0082 TaxID=2304604 RepID=A0A6M0SA69_9CYAN|nr:hypothetical protein [Adonisia turfae CCMR0082]
MNNPLRLTLTQHKIISLMATGWPNKKIARHLNICQQNVGRYQTQMCERVGAKTKYQLMAWYGTRGQLSKTAEEEISTQKRQYEPHRSPKSRKF